MASIHDSEQGAEAGGHEVLEGDTNELGNMMLDDLLVFQVITLARRITCISDDMIMFGQVDIEGGTETGCKTFHSNIKGKVCDLVRVTLLVVMGVFPQGTSRIWSVARVRLLS